MPLGRMAKASGSACRNGMCDPAVFCLWNPGHGSKNRTVDFQQRERELNYVHAMPFSSVCALRCGKQQHRKHVTRSELQTNKQTDKKHTFCDKGISIGGPAWIMQIGHMCMGWLILHMMLVSSEREEGKMFCRAPRHSLPHWTLMCMLSSSLGIKDLRNQFLQIVRTTVFSSSY